MDLNEYIKQSYERPNKAVLESLGASRKLIDYLCETPHNMNWNVVESIKGNGGSQPIKEAWFTVGEWTEENGNWVATLIPTELFTQEKEQDFFNKYLLYDVMVDDIKLYLFNNSYGIIQYIDVLSGQDATVGVVYMDSQWLCYSTIPNNPITTVYFKAPQNKDYNKWTTIRLNQIQVEGYSEYYYGTTNSEDLNKIKELITLYKTNQHPIIQSAYSMHYTRQKNNDYIVKTINSNSGIGAVFIQDGYAGVGIDFVDGALSNGAFMIYIYSTEQYLDDYVEIKYKTGIYYTITINISQDTSKIFYVEPNSIWDTTTLFNLIADENGAYLTDGTHNWYKGDTITFTSDMTLTLVVPKTYTIHWDATGADQTVEDTTGIQIGTMYTTPTIIVPASWMYGFWKFPDDNEVVCGEQFEFTQELADMATNYELTVVLYGMA